jgi:DNA-binding PadR family transcriptional regulator
MADPARLSPLGIAALALLAERAMHPYELYQLLMQRREDRLVKVRPGSLYHTVDRLLGQGLVRSTGTEREGNRPERTTYAITPEGRSALSDRVADMLATPVNEYPEFPLAVGEAHNLPRETVLHLLHCRRMRLQSEADHLATAVADLTARNIPRRFWLHATYQQALLDAEIAWIDSLRGQLETGTLDW